MDLLARVRRLCLALPSGDRGADHGAPTWFVHRRRSFAKFVAEHRFDEPSVAIWAAAPPGARHELVAADPGRFFEPPFGGSAWVAIPGDGPRESAHLLAEIADPVRFVDAATGRSSGAVLPVLR